MNIQDTSAPPLKTWLSSTIAYFRAHPFSMLGLALMVGVLLRQLLMPVYFPAGCGVMGDAQAWIDGCTKALARKDLTQTERVEALIFRGKARRLVEGDKGAITDFEDAALLDPNHWQATFIWSMTFQSVEPRWQTCSDHPVTGQALVEACSIFIDAAGEKGPVKRREALKIRAKAHQQLELSENRALAQAEEKAALADINAALKISPNDAEALRQRAFMSRRVGAFDNAVRDLTAVIDLIAPERRGRAFLDRGLLYSKQGKQDAARADFEAALKINPDDASAKRALKEIVTGTGSH
jgi:tetratricopeptide (TPR) repeat protein